MINYLNNNVNNSFGGGYGNYGSGGDDEKIAFIKGLLGGLLIGKLLRQLLGGGCNSSCGYGQNQSDSYNFGSGFGSYENNGDIDFNFNL